MAQAQQAQARLTQAGLTQAAIAIPGLRAPEPMGDSTATGDVLRADLPGITFRVPDTQTQLRLYGFSKMTSWNDFGMTGRFIRTDLVLQEPLNLQHDIRSDRFSQTG